MYIKASDDGHYVALGLSRDNKMGDDSVIACDHYGGEFRTENHWNRGPPTRGSDVTDSPAEGLSNLVSIAL